MDLKLKVEKVTQTQQGGHSIEFSGAWSGSALYTGGKSKLPLPEEVKAGAEIECVITEVKKKSGDGTWTAVDFPKYHKQKPQQQSGGTWKGGSREDVALKLTSFAMSYSKDLFQSTPDSTLDGMFATADKIADKMMEMYTIRNT